MDLLQEKLNLLFQEEGVLIIVKSRSDDKINLSVTFKLPTAEMSVSSIIDKYNSIISKVNNILSDPDCQTEIMLEGLNV